MAGLLLIDLSQLLISNLMVNLKGNANIEIEEDLVRHMILNSLRGLVTKFKKEYPEVVIACDSHANWRKQAFPFYKANRKKDRDNSILDWNAIFTVLSAIKQELKGVLPYKIVEVEGAEADDVIGALARYYAWARLEKVMICSSDKDFQQLQEHHLVSQYCPRNKTQIKCPNPKAFLKEHIIRGDRGDGVPNFLSDSDTFMVEKKRQKTLNSSKVEGWLNIPWEDLIKEMPEAKAGYERNSELIDLSRMPYQLQQKILEEHQATPVGSKQKLMQYFMAHRMRSLFEHLGDY